MKIIKPILRIRHQSKLNYHALSWKVFNFLELHIISWITMPYLELPWKTHGCLVLPWITLRYIEFSWSALIYHCLPLFILKYLNDNCITLNNLEFNCVELHWITYYLDISYLRWNILIYLELSQINFNYSALPCIVLNCFVLT